MTKDDPLLSALRTVLLDHPAGLSEFALMKALDSDAQVPFEKPSMTDSWALFQSHFWLFHHLYLLQMEFQHEGRRLDILATRIQLFDAESPGIGRDSDRLELVAEDPMRSYYLDLDNLEKETPAGVEAKLHAFWHRMAIPERASSDWHTLDMAPTQSADRLRAQYRRLCQKHHPDRGGDVQYFKEVQAAYARLKPLVS